MRLFVAVDIDDNLRKNMTPLLKLLSSFKGIKAVEPENLHITLKFLGEVDEIKLEKVKNELDKIEFSPFEIKFKGIGFFPNPNYMRVIWIGVEGDGIYDLADKIEKSMKRVGFKKDKEFKAHLTVGRVKRIDQNSKSRLLKELEGYDVEYGKMTVKNFRLKRSTLTPKGPIYDDVAIYGEEYG